MYIFLLCRFEEFEVAEHWPSTCQSAVFKLFSSTFSRYELCPLGVAPNTPMIYNSRDRIKNFTLLNSVQGELHYRFRYYIRNSLTPCGSHEFSCDRLGRTCIPLEWVCNGVSECDTGSDELIYCPGKIRLS